MSGSLPSAHVLVVEDDPMVRNILGMMLGEEYDVVSAASEQGAISLLQGLASKPDVILLDCLLPDGQPRTLLSMADRLNIGLVLISGDIRMAAAFAPHYTFLEKPFTRTALMAAIEAALDT